MPAVGTTDDVQAPERPVRVPVTGPRTAAAADIVLVGCSGSKAAAPTAESDLFTGAAFRKARELAVRSGKPWYVISAKFGLLDPDEVVAPYDVYLGSQPAQYRAAWGAWVVAQLAARCELAGAVVEVHAARTYTEPLKALLAAAGATLVEPLTGLRQGERLAWYSRGSETVPAPPTTAPSPSDVGSVLDGRNAMSPSTFLAGGRAAYDVPGLYSWRVDLAGARALSAGLAHPVDAGLVYAGRAGGQRPDGKVSTNTCGGASEACTCRAVAASRPSACRSRRCFVGPGSRSPTNRS